MSVLASIRSQARRRLAACGKYFLLPAATLGRRQDFPETGIPVHILVSSKTAPMCVLAAQSLEWFSRRKWRLVIHDDGSVRPDQRRFVEDRLPGCRFVPRAEADARAEDGLSACPASRRLRSRHNYLLKIFDPMLISGSGPWLLLDADVLFYRPAGELAAWATNPDTFFYMVDTKESYAHPRSALIARLGSAPVDRLNAGLCTLPAGTLDPQFCERVLSALEEACPHPMFLDQTILALAAGRDQARPLPATYEITWAMWRSAGAICRHYVGAFKEDLLYIEGPSVLLAKMTLPALRSRLN